jgi:hypothetical protein
MLTELTPAALDMLERRIIQEDEGLLGRCVGRICIDDRGMALQRSE